MNNAYNVSEPLRFLLGKKGITAYEFSKSVGINRAVTSQYLSGKKKASLSRIDLFCEYFGVSRSFFTDFDPIKCNEEINSDITDGECEIGFFENIRDLLSGIYDDHQLNNHRKSFEKFFNFYFDTLDVDQKREILHKMHVVVNDQQQGIEILDFGNSDLSNISEELSNLYMLLYELHVDLYGNNYKIKDFNQLKIRDRILSSPMSNNGVFEKRQFHVFKKGYESGLYSSLSDEEFYRYTSLKELSNNLSMEIDSFSENVLIDIENVLVDLQKVELYKDGIKDINITINDLGNDSYENGIREVNFFIDKLKLVKDNSLYIPASEVVRDLINGDKIKLGTDLILLREKLQEKINETIRLANIYQ